MRQGELSQEEKNSRKLEVVVVVQGWLSEQCWLSERCSTKRAILHLKILHLATPAHAARHDGLPVWLTGRVHV